MRLIFQPLILLSSQYGSPRSRSSGQPAPTPGNPVRGGSFQYGGLATQSADALSARSSAGPSPSSLCSSSSCRTSATRTAGRRRGATPGLRLCPVGPPSTYRQRAAQRCGRCLLRAPLRRLGSPRPGLPWLSPHVKHDVSPLWERAWTNTSYGSGGNPPQTSRSALGVFRLIFVWRSEPRTPGPVLTPGIDERQKGYSSGGKSVSRISETLSRSPFIGRLLWALNGWEALCAH